MSFDPSRVFLDDSDSDSTSTISYETPATRTEPLNSLNETAQAMMEKHTSSDASNGDKSAGASVPSSPNANQENLRTKPSTPRTWTPFELYERDKNAIAYAKSRLQEGDTLVFINYPSDVQVFDHTGFLLASQAPFRVHSEKLLATGSKKFQELFKEWPQNKTKRRRGFFGNHLPTGIKYVIDLTPPDEGDEAVDLISELSCSLGIRHWFSAQWRCKVSAEICGGKDEVAKPIKPKPIYKQHHDLVDVFTDPDYDPETSIVNDLKNYEATADEGVDLNGPARAADATTGTLAEREQKELREALKRSTMDTYNHTSAPPKLKEGPQNVNEIPEYCPIRHRAGIERLLQLIEGKEPRLDSAPKVWTLFVLAKYFDCTNVVVDFIVSWVLRDSNSQFIEILPEATLRMGLGLKSSVLTRPAFAILVSEYALSTISRECGSSNADKAGTNQFGRVREDIDEDSLSAVQAAAYSFIARVQSVLADLCDPRVAWLNNLPEYQKIARIVNWAHDNNISGEERQLIDENASALKRDLAHMVRGRILGGFNRDIWNEENNEANTRRKAETYMKEYKSDFWRGIYSTMAEKEKMMTRYSWNALRYVEFNTYVESNLLFDQVNVNPDIVKKNRWIAENHGVERVGIVDLAKSQSGLNEGILASIQKYGFNSSLVPEESFQETVIYNEAENDEDSDDWGAPAVFSAEDAPKAHLFESMKQTIPAGMRSDKKLNFELDFGSPSGRDFQDYLKSRKEGDMLDRDMLEKPETVGSSSSSTRVLYNFPLRPKPLKDNDLMPLESLASGRMINRISNIINASTSFLSTDHKLNDPREQAMDLHSRQASVSWANPVPPPTKALPNVPKTPKKSSPISLSWPESAPLPPQHPKLSEPRVPDDGRINSDSPFFSLVQFLDEAQQHVLNISNGMVMRGDELDFTILTDTLLCLTDDEWKYLPLWAGGNEDGSGGVFAPMIPPAPAGAGPSGPGPSFHTGYSMASRSGTETDFDGTSTIGESIDTSIAVENGYSDHFDRRRVMSDDDFHSEAFSDDTEDYAGKGGVKLHDYDAESDAGGNVSDDSEIYVGKGKGKAAVHDDIPRSSTPAKLSKEPQPVVEEDDEEEWDGGDDEDPFDYGDDTMTLEAHDDDKMSI